jgi:hypothetical protein
MTLSRVCGHYPHRLFRSITTHRENTMGTTTAAKAFPLQWPEGRARTKARQQARFADRTLYKSLEALKAEIGRLNAGYVVISTNIPLKANGDPYSDPGRMPDPGVAVYFRMKDKPYVLSCDRWISVEDNMYALAKHIEAMRGMERWGVASQEQTFAGFKALTETAGAGEDPWMVLGLTPMTSSESVLIRHRQLARESHPDTGGSEAAMTRLNVARDAALAALKAAAR